MRLLLAVLAAGTLAACGGAPSPAAGSATTTPPSVPPETIPPTTATPAVVGTTPAPTPKAVSPSPAAVTRRAFPVAGCRVTYGRAHHDYPATDIFAARGCAFVSPVSGRVDEVSRTDRWSSTTNRGADRGGLFVSVVGDDGVRYYGSHLSAVATGIRPGLRVTVGTRLGSVGNTGSARGIATHLHFGLSWPTGPGVWWVRRGVVNPYEYLRSWQSGGSRSPAAEVRACQARC